MKKIASVVSILEVAYTIFKSSDGTCKKNVKSAISGFKVTGTKMLPRGDSAMLTAVSDPNIGVLSVAIGVVDSFFSFKVRFSALI
jgi:hypothetical protein